jgi:two-component system sensor histidine kinase/response regulator
MADQAKILLVDDSPENLVSLEAALEGLGQELVLAQSGTQALRHLLEDDFAVILLDVKMPEMDGFQTAELIRSRKRSRHTPILFITGYKSDDHLFRGYDLGAVDFLFKPLVPEVLRSKVSVFVELSRNTALLRELNATLEQRVAERTAELQASNEALRQSNDDLNQFAYAASHDLQEPMRLVALYSQMLQKKYDGRLDRQADQYIAFIVNGAHRMEMLLKDLLAYSQVGASGEGPAVPVVCADVLRKVLLNLQAGIEQNGAVVTWNGLPTVQAHDIRMVQLFQNLVGNAIKYRRPEPPRIRVNAQQRTADWLFSVEDNGIGIKPEYSQQVFGIFKRLHGNTYPGTGIGLAICQRIVESYGGRIWVESTPGEGSTFFFTLPRGSADSPPERRSVA